VPEYGKEWVYAVDLCQPGTLEAHVPELADADPDVHLLSDLEEGACLARGHTDLSFDVEPGRYYVTVDTFVANGLELEGAFELDMVFTPQAGTVGCAEGEVCEAGSCVVPGEGGGGAGPGPAGPGAGGADATGGAGGGAGADDPGGDDGCSCRSGVGDGGGANAWLFAAAVAAGGALRRRRPSAGQALAASAPSEGAASLLARAS
jgi:MYXO-CTERM domain-containing protein